MRSTPVSLADIYPTLVAAVGAELTEADADLPGRSLLALAGADEPDRVVFSEYHGPLSIAASYLIRRGPWKYVRYQDPNSDPQLFDLGADPHEGTDLGTSPDHEPIRADLDLELGRILDPDEVDERIRAHQAVALDAAGGLQPLVDAAKRTPAAGGPYGTIRAGYTIPPPEILEVIGARR